MDGMDGLIFVRDFGEEFGIWYKIQNLRGTP